MLLYFLIAFASVSLCLFMFIPSFTWIANKLAFPRNASSL